MLNFLNTIPLNIKLRLLDLLIFLLYIALPIFFSFRLWKNKNFNFWNWLILASTSSLYLVFLSAAGSWCLTYGLLVKNILIVIFVCAMARSFLIMKGRFVFKQPKLKISFFLGFLFIGILSKDLFSVFKGNLYPKKVLDLGFPLKGGSFAIAQGGSTEYINHHHSIRAQKYALDIVELNNVGIKSTTFFPKKLKDFCIFGSKLYSPCDGIIIEAFDDLDDLTPLKMDKTNPAGNYIALESDKAIIILAHLQKNSLQVKKGDRITKGQVIAKVGNSGNTSEPHLHIHAVEKNSEDYLFKGEGIPITFNKKYLVRNNLVKISMD